jgi:hypothetical protein
MGRNTSRNLATRRRNQKRIRQLKKAKKKS